MAVAKRKGKAHENKTKEGPRARRTSGKTNGTPGQPNLYRAGPGEEEKTYKKKEPKFGGDRVSLWVFWISMPSCLKDVFFFTFLKKTELQHGAETLVHHFKFLL